TDRLIDQTLGYISASAPMMSTHERRSQQGRHCTNSQCLRRAENIERTSPYKSSRAWDRTGPPPDRPRGKRMVRHPASSRGHMVQPGRVDLLRRNYRFFIERLL